MSGMEAMTAGAAMSVFNMRSQQNRLLRIAFPCQDGPDATLLVNTLTAREELSRSFRFDVELLSDDARIPLKVMMARMVTISLVREDGSLRYFNGYVTEFRFLHTDGGFAFYQMVLEPWLAFARLRKDNVSFHAKSVMELTEITFAHYRQRDWQTLIVGEYPRLKVANQYNETDYNHLHRRWEGQGLHYWYEHRAEGHTLWLSDRSTLANPIDATDTFNPNEIPFRSKAGSLEDDGIREWKAIRRIGSGMMTLASFDYKNPRVQTARGDSLNVQGDVFAHEIYENTGSYGFRTSGEGNALAFRTMQERNKTTQYFEARGNDRTAQAGRMFKLGGHFSAAPEAPRRGEAPRRSIADRDYLIVSVDHTASNNYHAGPTSPSHYENRFTAIRKDILWKPGRNYHSEPCTCPGMQTAIVVGPKGAEIHTDGHGRVKVQFHWDRLGTYDEKSSPWIRVMSPSSGSQFGHIRLPRVGEEVAVLYLDGNIDKPIILGAVYNQTHMPPWKLPEQSALAGWRSRELNGGGNGTGRSNHLVLDDTAGKIQVQLRSDHQHSQLSLGHITRIDSNAGRKDARGEGFELTTDAWGILRANRGMLITTDARANAGSHIKDMDEAVQRLGAAQDRHQMLADMARRCNAQEGEGQQVSVAEAIQAQNNGIKGTGSDTFPELSEPHLVFSSPAGIEMATAASVHIASDKHTAITSGKNLSIACIDSMFASIGKTFRLFVHQAGMKLVAAAGKVSIEAQSDDVEVIANKVLTLLSESDWVDIRGKKGVRLHGANHMLEISDQVQFFTSSPVLFNGNLETLAPKSISQSFNERPTSRFDQEVRFLQADNQPAPRIDYELVRDDGAVIGGATAGSGTTGIQKGAGIESYTIRYKGELP